MVVGGGGGANQLDIRHISDPTQLLDELNRLGVEMQLGVELELDN